MAAKRTETIKERLEYLRGELRAERLGWAELAELQSLAPHIDRGDVELLEAAGVPEQKPTVSLTVKEDEKGKPSFVFSIHKKGKKRKKL
jgi:hypothetical protein